MDMHLTLPKGEPIHVLYYPSPHNPWNCVGSLKLENQITLPDFYENSIKSCARLERKKSRKRGARKKKFRKIIVRNVKGGWIPPPPGLIRVNEGQNNRNQRKGTNCIVLRLRRLFDLCNASLI